MSKEKTRKELIEKRKKILDNDKKSSKIIEKLIQTEEYLKAKRIMFYYSLPSEVQTQDTIREELSKKEKIILLPYCSENNTIKASEIKDVELVKSSFGVLEPAHKIESNENIDIIIVPGVGFDISGNRLGFGKGSYDRFISKNLNSTRIGIVFDELLIDSIPTESHDQKVDMIITEKKIIRCT